ncbi:MAG: class IV adenylate cyclase [Dehalococcoidia bacterium]
MEDPTRSNLERKTPLNDVRRAEAALRALGATDAGILVQRDTYFRVATGRLKLREMPERAELIAYDRDESSTEMLSRYTVTPVDQPSATREALAAHYGIRGVVEKSRSLWLYKNGRIHLDHVGGLGAFLEIEVVDPRTPAEGRALMNELVVALSLDLGSAVQASYIDLLEALERPSPHFPH